MASLCVLFESFPPTDGFEHGFLLGFALEHLLFRPTIYLGVQIWQTSLKSLGAWQGKVIRRFGVIDSCQIRSFGIGDMAVFLLDRELQLIFLQLVEMHTRFFFFFFGYIISNSPCYAMDMWFVLVC